VITSKPTWKLKHTNSILEYSEYFCHISSKSLVVILSYTVLKLRRFFWDTVYIIRKPMKQRFQHCMVCTKILSTFHTWVEYIFQRSLRHSAHSNEWGANAEKCQKPCQKQPLPLEARGLPSNTLVRGPTPLPTTNDRSVGLHTSAQLRNKGPFGNYDGTPEIHPQNCPFPFDDHHQNLIHPYQVRPHSPPQMASGSNRPFCHNTLCGQTHTDGPGECSAGLPWIWNFPSISISISTDFAWISMDISIYP